VFKIQTTFIHLLSISNQEMQYPFNGWNVSLCIFSNLFSVPVPVQVIAWKDSSLK